MVFVLQIRQIWKKNAAILYNDQKKKKGKKEKQWWIKNTTQKITY
jgi:hypothetical protein